MKPTVCYVDDDEKEIERFRKFLSPYYDIAAGTTFAKPYEIGAGREGLTRWARRRPAAWRRR